jgi:hypothetical protein
MPCLKSRASCRKALLLFLICDGLKTAALGAALDELDTELLPRRRVAIELAKSLIENRVFRDRHAVSSSASTKHIGGDGRMRQAGQGRRISN